MKRILFLVMVIASVAWSQPIVSGPDGPKQITTGSISFVRPTDATQYGANEAVANSTTAGNVSILKFSTFKKAGILRSMTLIVDTANVANSKFRLWLFNDSANVTKSADNAQFTLKLDVTNIQNFIGYVDFDSLVTEGTGSTAAFAQVDHIDKGFTVGDLRQFYGLLEVKQAYTPKNGGEFIFRYWLEQ